MRIFHELVLESFIEGATGFFPPRQPDHWYPVLGHFETLRVIAIADHVSGDSPSLSLDLWESPDFTEVRKVGLVNLASGGLVAGQTNIFQGSFTPDSALPASYGYWIYCGLFGPGPAPPIAHVRIWVTGRGRA